MRELHEKIIFKIRCLLFLINVQLIAVNSSHLNILSVLTDNFGTYSLVAHIKTL